ncbi:Imm32 family immunity protein [Verrucomicrobiota bacterium]
MKNDYLLEFETEPDGDVVHIHGSSAGLAYLIEQLSWLKQKVDQGQSEHVHLMTKDWGGPDSGLSNELQDLSGNSKLVHHVKMLGWAEDNKEERPQNK